MEPACNQSSSSWGHNGTMRYSVLWKTRGMSVKGDNQSIHNNLVYDSLLYSGIFLRTYPGSDDGFKGERNIFLQHPCGTYWIPRRQLTVGG